MQSFCWQPRAASSLLNHFSGERNVVSDRVKLQNLPRRTIRGGGNIWQLSVTLTSSCWEGRSASTRPQTGSGEPEIGSLAQNITTTFWLFSAWKGLNVKLPVWVYRSWRYPAWSVWFIHLRHKTFDLYWVFTFYHIKSCRWNPVGHFKVEMQRSDINICIRPDIEYNSRSGIGDNVPNP